MKNVNRLYDSLNPEIPAHQVVIEINKKNEVLYGPYHEKCGQFAQFCNCLGEDNVRLNKK